MQEELFQTNGAPNPGALPADPAPECSEEALAKVNVETLRRLCLAEFENRVAGATADDICRAVRWKVPGNIDELSIRPRVTELKKAGLIFPTGLRRTNRKGNSCAVLAHVKFIKGTFL